MRILYIYPHPGDESFGPAPAMARQKREEHGVYLLTLTRGGATSSPVDCVGSVRERGRGSAEEMQGAVEVLDLNGMRLLDFPAGGLKELDPRFLEKAVAEEIVRIQPDVVVTYPVHGIGGFHDHLVVHAVVKRVFSSLLGRVRSLKRLAFNTISEEEAERTAPFHLGGSIAQEVDCRYSVDRVDIEKALRARDCYESFGERTARSGIEETLGTGVLFEIFQENHEPPLSDLFEKLVER